MQTNLLLKAVNHWTPVGLGRATRDCKGAWGKSWLCSLSWFWWFYGFIHMAKIFKLYTLNMYRLLHVNYASIKFLKQMVQNKKNLDLPLFLETIKFNNSILTPLYFFPFLRKGSPESVLEIWASNGGRCSLGQQDHWLDHKRHIRGQQGLHSLFSFPCLYSNGLELTSPERQWEFTKPLDCLLTMNSAIGGTQPLEGLWFLTATVSGRFMDAH